MSASVTLPAPPSPNKLWVPVTHNYRATLVKSKAYRAWIQSAIPHVWKQRPDKIPNRTPFGVKVECVLSRRRDVDGVVKALLDLLGPRDKVKPQGMGIIPDDRWADTVQLERVQKPERNEDESVKISWWETPPI